MKVGKIPPEANEIMKSVLVIAVAVLISFGCGRQAKPAAPSQTQSPGGATVGEPAAAAPKYVTAVAENRPAENVTGEVDAFLTEQLGLFIREKRRLPESFAELVRTRLDSVPRPPTGKKWVIDSATRQVKAASAQ